MARTKEELKKFFSKVEYRRTNEGLRGIVIGMNIQPRDRILAVGGSGDQSFAMLEYVPEGRVITTDLLKNQVEFILHQAKTINQGGRQSYLNFMYARGLIPSDVEFFEEFDALYFSERRLEAIRQNINNLRLVQGDVVKVAEAKKGKFNKIYLSNSLFYNGESDALAEKQLRRAAAVVPRGGLIYHAEINESILPFTLQSLGNMLEVDKELSAAALEDTGKDFPWQPIVFRRK
jgi:hypothetical protein